MAAKFSETFSISVDLQGINLIGLDLNALQIWIKKEVSFNGQLDAIARTQLVIPNTSYGSSQNLGTIQSHLNNLTKLAEGAGNHSAIVDALDKFLEPARRGERLLADGPVSKYLLKLVGENKMEVAHLPLLIFSLDFRNSHGEVQRLVDLYRVMMLSPVHGSFTNLYAANSANEASQAAKKLMSEELSEVKQLVEEQKEEMTRLHELYHAKLLIEAPALHWQGVWKDKTTQWKLWLSVLGVAILVPAMALVIYGREFVQLLGTLNPTGSQFSLSGLAILIVPASLYAWFLKQIIRIYTRSFDLAVDAAHRKALSITFLGLAENPKLGVTQVDRSIILQALFRPQPPHLSEDGPPMGLIELIKGKD